MSAPPQKVLASQGKTSSQKFAEADALYGPDALAKLSHTERSLKGLPYLANDPALVRARLRARRLFHAFNQTLPNPNDPEDLPEGRQPQGIGGSQNPGTQGGAPPPVDVMGDERRDILAKLLGVDRKHVEKVEIEPPLYMDYGTNLHLEGSFYANCNTTILDCAEITIGDGTLFGPNVHLYCGTHSVSVAERTQGYERALPIKIGRDCWLGGNVSVMAGVTIGDGVTIGAGSIVTRDIPSWSVAVGNPARVVKVLTEEERGSH